jgi:hypothetical protein
MLLSCGVVVAQTPAPPQFRAGVDVFELEVSVVDRNREPVRGLPVGSFTVLENGVAQRVVSFQEVEFPEFETASDAPSEIAPDVTNRRYVDRRLFVIVMDDWGLTSTGSSLRTVLESKAVARSIVEQLGPLDLAAVILTRDTRYSRTSRTIGGNCSARSNNSIRPSQPSGRGSR